MKISEYFKLGASQHEIDFVDVDVANDMPLFIDPHFLASRSDRWSKEATLSIRSFFRVFLEQIRLKNNKKALNLFTHLKEPNETRLGLSKGKSQGRGVGREDALKIFDSISTSRAVQSGLVKDIEDTRILVEGVDKDKVSDMATNIIRRHLIKYTQDQCRLWHLPLTPGVPSGSLWNRMDKDWEEVYTEMLVINGRKILLVPKSIVSFNFNYTPQKYHQHFILNYLQSCHLSINSALVKERKIKKTGEVVRYVTKKSIREKEAPYNKSFIVKFTESHPDIFENFKTADRSRGKSIENYKLTNQLVKPVIDRLIDALHKIAPGNEGASRYHKTVSAMLELIFYPNLIAPELEQEINQGRKRIDLVFDNAAEDGFFKRLHVVHKTPCQYVMIECKNYGKELGNPELDQMIGRLSPNHGQFGIIVCRSIQDEALFIQRCSDAYKQKQGTIIPLTDKDVIDLLQEIRDREENKVDIMLSDKLKKIVFG